jgi:hypothetical protein
MTSAFLQIFAKSLRACSGKSAAFATVESLNASSSLVQLKTSEGELSLPTRMEETEARLARMPIFLTSGDESWLRRGWHVSVAGKGPEKEENCQVALSGIISHLAAKCGGNVHDRGVVEITASSSSTIAHNATDLENRYSLLCSENGPVSAGVCIWQAGFVQKASLHNK